MTCMHLIKHIGGLWGNELLSSFPFSCVSYLGCPLFTTANSTEKTELDELYFFFSQQEEEKKATHKNPVTQNSCYPVAFSFD